MPQNRPVESRTATEHPAVCQKCGCETFRDCGIALGDGLHGAAQVWQVRCEDCGAEYWAVMYQQETPAERDWRTNPHSM